MTAAIPAGPGITARFRSQADFVVRAQDHGYSSRRLGLRRGCPDLAIGTYQGVIGYRVLSVDYAQGEGRRRYEFDMLQHGPVLGLSARF